LPITLLIRNTLDLPLHTGKCPSWLFEKMKKLALQISEIIVDEFGKEELLKRLSDSFWLQSLGCVLGFDWHSSGLTTTTMAALKESLNEVDLGIRIAGGKGVYALKTKEEIEELSENLGLNQKRTLFYQEMSSVVAKIDNNLVQDNYNLYLHFFVFTKDSFTVVQQGMNEKEGYARRYHWFIKENYNLIEEPHSSVLLGKEEKNLNLTSNENKELRDSIVDLVNYDLKKVLEIKSKPLLSFLKNDRLPKEHLIKLKHLSKKEIESLKKLEDLDIKEFKDLLKVKGLGKEGIRALALTSNLIYGTPISWKDFVKYSFSHGGKDGTPFPVNKKVYENTINIFEFVLKELKEKGKIKNEKKYLSKIKRLNHLIEQIYY